MEWFNGALATVFVLGIAVLVHEVGHFVAAKAFGVYAPRFSIGFGPSLISKLWGETEYVLAALPLGGYVRMASREDESMAALEGGGEKAPPLRAQRPTLSSCRLSDRSRFRRIDSWNPSRHGRGSSFCWPA